MHTEAVPPANTHDLRLDLFLGLANWFIFLDHIPNNVVSLITLKNYGFSGAADLFIFVAGYTASVVHAESMLERGFIVGTTRIIKRVWQLYAAYIVLFVIYIVTIGYVATQYAAPDIIYEFNVGGLIDHPIRTVGHGLFLQSKVLNLDLLQLYIALMAFFPLVLWAMLRKPDLTIAASLALYLVAREYEWNLPSFPDGNWNFNPFCWQLLFSSGSWLALGGSKRLRVILESRLLGFFGIAYLAFALVMTMAGQFPQFGKMFPAWLFDAFNPNDKTNLALYRVLHLIILMFLVPRFLTKYWRGLDWQIFRPIIKCGQQPIAAFCAGVFLSFAGHLLLVTGSGSVTAQIFVSVAGLAIMSLVAGYISWSKQQDKPLHMASVDAR